MNFGKKYLPLLFVLLLFSGCTLAKISGRGNLPLILNTLPTESTLVQHFEVSKMIAFDYTGSFDVSEVLNSKYKNRPEADAITNLVITIKSDFGSFFVNLITLGLANAQIFVVEGDLVKLPKGFKYSSLYDLDGQKTQYSLNSRIMIKNDQHTSEYMFIKENDDKVIVLDKK